LSRWHGRQAAAEDQLGVHQLIERTSQTILVQGTHGGQQIVRELTPNCGTDLGHLLDPGEAVEARHERILQGRRDGERRQRAGKRVMVAGIGEQARFQDGLGQLLDEQRDAVCLGEDLVEDLMGQRLAAGHRLDQRLPVAAGQARQRQLHDVGMAGPGRAELGPEGDQH
jgi:hypothetical protein